jgi:uncharacterized protein
MVSGEVELPCQRGLVSMPYKVEVERTLYLARNEAEMERLDALPDSDAIQAGEMNLVIWLRMKCCWFAAGDDARRR